MAPRERERWPAIRLLAQGGTAPATADALGRAPHTLGRWATAFGQGESAALIFEPTGGSPALGEAQQGELRAAAGSPAMAGIALGNWNRRVIHRFVRERGGDNLWRRSCLNCRRRQGFAFQRPRKRLVKAAETRRNAFMMQYVASSDAVERTGGKLFFADAELRGRRGTAGPTRNCGANGR